MKRKKHINKEKRKEVIVEVTDREKSDIFYCSACDLYYVINKRNDIKGCPYCLQQGDLFEE